MLRQRRLTLAPQASAAILMPFTPVPFFPPHQRNVHTPKKTPVPFSLLDRQAGADEYDARVVNDGIPGRSEGLNAERARSNSLRQQGNSMSKHKRP